MTTYFDNTKVYYKTLYKNLKHYGLLYKLGLNVDTLIFNPTGSCEAGGIYFTEKQFLYKYVAYHTYVAELTIPDDAQVYKDPEGDKWKADKILIHKIYKIDEFEGWQDNAFCMNAVQYNGFNLQYIKSQTEEMCVDAVTENGYAITFVINMTPTIKNAAINTFKKRNIKNTYTETHEDERKEAQMNEVIQVI
jgi:hypothetical protein